MIEMKEAMEIAKNFINEVSGRKEGFRLEEAYPDEKKKYWQITYSFIEPLSISSLLQEAAQLNGRRVYRTIQIDNKTGDVIGMKAGFSSNQSAIA